MLALIQHHGATLGACFAIGAATAWWMFHGERRRTRPEEERKP